MLISKKLDLYAIYGVIIASLIIFLTMVWFLTRMLHGEPSDHTTYQRYIDKELGVVCYSGVGRRSVSTCVKIDVIPDNINILNFEISKEKESSISRYLDKELGISCYDYNSNKLSCFVIDKN